MNRTLMMCVAMLSTAVGCEELNLPLPGASPAECDGTTEAQRLADALVEQGRAAGYEIDAGRVSSARLPRGHTVARAPARDGAELMYLSEAGRYLDPGLYEIVTLADGAAEFRLVSVGRDVIFDISGPDQGASQATTPLGDDLCGDAPDLIQGFCQDFVACAAYDLWC